MSALPHPDPTGKLPADSEQSKNLLKLRVAAERTFLKIFDKSKPRQRSLSRGKQDDRGWVGAAQAGAHRPCKGHSQVARIFKGFRRYEEFVEEFDHEEIAKLHFNHYRTKRISKNQFQNSFRIPE